MVCCVAYHVHAVGTTGLHAAERRRFEYAATCAQCGAALDETTHVASHVLSYPCYPLNCCVARLSLQTCCRTCNGRHQAGPATGGGEGMGARGGCGGGGGCVDGFTAAPGPPLEKRWRWHGCCWAYHV